ncbi:MAG: hypothetical protein OXC92_00055 [Flavobacteriaceae bacterium]|nr:hypothetical protein [Flavobacteriaceae bacterium]
MMLCISIDPKDENRLKDFARTLGTAKLKPLTHRVLLERANEIKKNGFEWDYSGYEF